MRINHVKSARKSQGICEYCRQEIEKGTGYKWIKPRYGAKRSRHDFDPTWRPSEMTGSKMATAWAAQEAANDSLNEFDMHSAGFVLDHSEEIIEDIKAILQDAANGGQDCADDYQEGLEAMPEGLQYGSVGEEIQDKIYALEDWIQNLEGWEPDSEDPGGDPKEWLSEVVESAREVVDGLGV